jgi:hypothetical protein
VLAPVLARLDAIPGVVAARVDSSGRFFWLQVEDAADATSVTALAFGLLGKGVRSLAAEQAKAQLAARRKGDPWLTAAEVMTLSFVESRILSVRLAGEVAHVTGATPEQREELAEAIRLELFATMERVHSEGGRRSGGWIYEEWPAIAAAAVERCAAAMPQGLCRRLSEVLPALLTH